MKVFRVYLNSLFGGERQECSRPNVEQGKKDYKDFLWFYAHKRLSLFCGSAFKQWRCAKAEAQTSVQFPLVMVRLMLFLFVIITNIRLRFSQLLDASPKQSVDSHSSLNVPF